MGNFPIPEMGRHSRDIYDYNKNTENCYCFFHEMESFITFDHFCHIQKFQAPPMSHILNQEKFQDLRSDAQIARDIIAILNFNFMPALKKEIDQAVFRDVSKKERINNIYSTKKQLREAVKKWKADNKVEDHTIFNEINSDNTVPSNYKKYYDEQGLSKNILVNINISPQYLHTLPSCYLYMCNRNGEFSPILTVIDSASTNPVLSYSIFKKLGYSDSLINKSHNYSLTTASDQKNKSSILGDFVAQVYFYFKMEYFALPVKLLILHTSLPYLLFDISSLRQCQYRMEAGRGCDQPDQLTLYPPGCTSVSGITISLHPPSSNHSIFAHATAINTPMVQPQVPETDDSHKDLITHSDTLEDLILDRFSMVKNDDIDNFMSPDLSNCTSTQKRILHSIFSQFPNIMGSHPYDTGHFRGFQATIEIKPAAPQVYQRPRRFPPHQINLAREVINNLEKFNIIEKSTFNDGYIQNILMQEKTNTGKSLADKLQAKIDKYEQKVKTDAQWELKGKNRPVGSTPRVPKLDPSNQTHALCAPRNFLGPESAKLSEIQDSENKFPAESEYKKQIPPNSDYQNEIVKQNSLAPATKGITSNTNQSQKPYINNGNDKLGAPKRENLDPKDPKPKKPKMRLLCDLRLTNKNIVVPGQQGNYTKPEILLKTQGVVALSIDILQSFYNIKVKPNHRKYLQFHFDNSIYHYVALPQGLASAPVFNNRMYKIIFSPETLNKFMEIYKVTFDPIEWLQYLIQYFDDIVYLSQHIDDHPRDIKIVFFALNYHGLKINLSKSKFYATKFTFLGQTYNLEASTSCISDSRKEAILHYRQPQCHLTLASRLSSMNYFSEFICAFRVIAWPLFNLLTKPFKWTPFYNECWHNILFLIKISMHLSLPRNDWPLILTSDASYLSFSYCLFNYNLKVKKLQLITSQSRIFPKSQRSKSILDKEVLGLMAGITGTEIYLRSNNNSITVIIDAIALSFIRHNNTTTKSLMNLSLLLSEFPLLQLISSPSCCNHNSDFISRLYKSKKATIDKTGLVLYNDKFYQKPMLFTSDQVTQFLFNPPADAIQCHPKEVYDEIKNKSILDRIEYLFEEPRELQYLRAAGKDLNLISQDHSLWADLYNNKKVSHSQLVKLVQKYRLTDLSISSQILLTNISKGDNYTCFSHQLQVFVDEVRKYLKINRPTSSLFHKLNNFRNKSPTEQFDLLKSIDYYFQEKFKFSIENLSDFVLITPYLFDPRYPPQVDLKMSKTGILVYLKDSINLSKGQLLLINLNLILFSKSSCIYMDTTDTTKECFFNLLFSSTPPHHYFHQLQLFSNKKQSILNTQVLFQFKGFTKEFSITPPLQYDRITIHSSKNDPFKSHFYLPHSPAQCDNFDCQDHQNCQQLKITTFLPLPLQCNEIMKGLFPNKPDIHTQLVTLVDTLLIIIEQSEKQVLPSEDLLQILHTCTILDPYPNTLIPPALGPQKRPLNPQKLTHGGINQLLFVQNLLKMGDQLDVKSLLKLQLSDSFGQEKYLAAQSQNSNYVLIDSLLFFKSPCKMTGKILLLLYLPNSAAHLIFQHLHHSALLHVSKKEILNVFSRTFHTQNAENIAKQVSDNCAQCVLGQSVRFQSTEGDKRTLTSTQCNEIHVLDYLQALPLTANGYSFLLIVVDSYTMFTCAVPTKTLTAQETLTAYTSVTAITGYPAHCLTDSASCFGSVFTNFLQLMNINHWRRQQGLSKGVSKAELQIKNFRNYLTKALFTTDNSRRANWDLNLGSALTAFNMTSLYESRISRAALFHQNRNYYLHNSPIMAAEDEDTFGTEILQKISEKRQILAKKVTKHHGIKAGMLVMLLTPNSKQPQNLKSKYLLPTAQSTHLVLFVDCFSLKLRNLNTGAVSTANINEVRKIRFTEFIEIQNSFKPELKNIFNLNKYKRGQQPFFLTEDIQFKNKRGTNKQSLRQHTPILDPQQTPDPSASTTNSTPLLDTQTVQASPVDKPQNTKILTPNTIDHQTDQTSAPILGKDVRPTGAKNKQKGPKTVSTPPKTSRGKPIVSKHNPIITKKYNLRSKRKVLRFHDKVQVKTYNKYAKITNKESETSSIISLNTAPKQVKVHFTLAVPLDLSNSEISLLQK